MTAALIQSGTDATLSASGAALSPTLTGWTVAAVASFGDSTWNATAAVSDATTFTLTWTAAQTGEMPTGENIEVRMTRTKDGTTLPLGVFTVRVI